MREGKGQSPAVTGCGNGSTGRDLGGGGKPLPAGARANPSAPRALLTRPLRSRRGAARRWRWPGRGQPPPSSGTSRRPSSLRGGRQRSGAKRRGGGNAGPCRNQATAAAAPPAVHSLRDPRRASRAPAAPATSGGAPHRRGGGGRERGEGGRERGEGGRESERAPHGPFPQPPGSLTPPRPGVAVQGAAGLEVGSSPRARAGEAGRDSRPSLSPRAPGMPRAVPAPAPAPARSTQGFGGSRSAPPARRRRPLSPETPVKR